MKKAIKGKHNAAVMADKEEIRLIKKITSQMISTEIAIWISIANKTPKAVATPLPNSISDQTNWNPCPGRSYSWTAQGQFERIYDRACVGGIATSGLLGLCLGGTELNDNGPWSGSESGPITVSIATDSSISSTGLTSLVAICQW